MVHAPALVAPPSLVAPGFYAEMENLRKQRGNAMEEADKLKVTDQTNQPLCHIQIILIKNICEMM